MIKENVRKLPWRLIFQLITYTCRHASQSPHCVDILGLSKDPKQTLIKPVTHSACLLKYHLTNKVHRFTAVSPRRLRPITLTWQIMWRSEALLIRLAALILIPPSPGSAGFLRPLD